MHCFDCLRSICSDIGETSISLFQQIKKCIDFWIHSVCSIHGRHQINELVGFVFGWLYIVHVFFFIEQAGRGDRGGRADGADQNVFEKCKNLTNATNEDIKTILSHKVPETRESKCFLACLQKTFGVVRIS